MLTNTSLIKRGIWISYTQFDIDNETTIFLVSSSYFTLQMVLLSYRLKKYHHPNYRCREVGYTTENAIRRNWYWNFISWNHNELHSATRKQVNLEMGRSSVENCSTRKRKCYMNKAFLKKREYRQNLTPIEWENLKEINMNENHSCEKVNTLIRITLRKTNLPQHFSRKNPRNALLMLN